MDLWTAARHNANMQNSIRTWFLLTALTFAASAQTILEHAMVTGPAAAGATTGALAGAKLGQILSQAGSQASTAAKTGEAKPAEVKPEPVAKPSLGQAAPTLPAGHFAATPAISGPGGGAPARAAGGKAPAAMAAIDVPGSIQPATPAIPAAPKGLTREELLAGLTSIQPGSARAEVLEKLGQPTYKIAYDDGGAMVERYKFRAGGQDIVVVELKDGVVDTARPLVH